MKVRVLGCSGAIAKDCRTTSFLIDNDVLVDAGTGVGDLTLDEMRSIDHVLLTHSHLDHVAALPLMIDAIASKRSAPVKIHALPGTIAALKTHIFNNVIWPDFSRIPTPQAPFITFHELQVGQTLDFPGKRIEVLPAVHTVPAVGYAVHGSAGAWVFTGDTGPNPALWIRLRHMKIAHLVIETAFSDEERQLAYISRHLCPAALGHELAQLPGSVEVHITHIKPGETEAVMSEVGKLASSHRIRALSAGQTMRIGE